MNYTEEQMAEIDMLIRFDPQTTLAGLKVHSDANTDQVQAVQRLFDKGLVTLVDGGYLTELGRTAADHARALTSILAPHNQRIAS